MSNNNFYQNPGFSAQLPGAQPPISANQQAQYQGGFQQQAYYPPQSSFGPPQGGLPPPPSTNSFTGPPQYNGAGGSITQPPKSNVQFFSIAGGAPTPSNVLSATPPSIAPPPTFNSNQQINSANNTQLNLQHNETPPTTYRFNQSIVNNQSNINFQNNN